MAESSGNNALGSSLKTSLESAERIVFASLNDILAGDNTAYAAYSVATAALEVAQRQQGQADEQDDAVDGLAADPLAPVFVPATSAAFFAREASTMGAATGKADQIRVEDEVTPPSPPSPRPDVGSIRTPARRVEKSRLQRMSMSSLLRQVARGKAAGEEIVARQSEQISDQSEQVRNELGTRVYPWMEEGNSPSAAPQAPPPA
ncbi:MAG: hypothetical protein M1839_007090 [Geoglossum umbratile]|nr:MAG: hypothetical protein M1839_007090 [Geoglossum umbratile]